MKESDDAWEIALARFYSEESCKECYYKRLKRCPMAWSDEVGPDGQKSKPNERAICTATICKMNVEGKCTHRRHPAHVKLEDMVMEDL